MKKFIMWLTYLVSLGSLLYMIFEIPEPTNKQMLIALFNVMVIIVLSIQREDI